MSQGYKRINENENNIHDLVSMRIKNISKTQTKRYNMFDNVVLHRNSRSWTTYFVYSVGDKMHKLIVIKT